MQRRWTWTILLLIALVAMWGCSSDDGPVNPTKTDFQTMAEAATPIINDAAVTPGTIAATTLHDNLASYTVIDIRSAADFAKGHIPGAVNSSLATLLDDLTNGTIPAGKPYVVACYSGQSAGYAKIAMSLMGYDVHTLLFGMSSWSAATRTPWDSKTVDAASSARNLVAAPETANNNAELTVHDYPTIAATGGAVVAERVRAVLNEGLKGISYATVAANPDMYFIVNYFGQADYEGTGSAGAPGHIPGAYQFTPNASLGWGGMLANLPSDGTPIVVYCWTGQHSAQVTAYLRMLGYDAYSLLYGSNVLFYDSLTAHKWTAAAYNDFDLELGSTPTPAFAAVAAAGEPIVNAGGVTPGTIAATTLHDNLSSYTVIDLRSQADYDTGHIPGAVHSGLATLLDDLTNGNIPTGKPYVVACYSGQSAGHAKIAMEMLGYDVYTLLWGMSSWSSTTRGSWDNKTVNAAMADRNQVTVPETANNNGSLVGHPFPALAGDAGTAVATAAASMLANGFKSVSYATVAANPEMYFVVNYFGQADYEGTGSAGVPGHIPGAYQFTPYASLGMDQMLADLPSDGTPIVVYCWTGQHSSQVTAYLNMLGYNAYSLSNGSNVLFYDSLTAHKWTAAAYNDFDLEATPLD